MQDRPQVVLSALADEAANHKTAVEQFSALAALGLQYYSLRFIDVGSGVRNVMQLSKSEITRIRHLEDEYGLNVATIGSPIGKIKLRDVQDGTKNAYCPFRTYLSRDVKRACQLAHAFEAKMIRGFSFYPPRGADPADHIDQAVEQLGQIAEVCHRSDLTFGLEVEANLVGQNGVLMSELHRQVNHPAMVLVFDAANILCQGFSTRELFEQYQAMKPAIGWLHIKDYRHPRPAGRAAHVDEDTLKHFVPADSGDAAHEVILRDFATVIAPLSRKLRRRGLPGVVVDLEPHLKGGGQFGGFSGPDGMGVALRSLCRILDYASIGYHLRDFDDIVAARGF
jgi:sugar phosphate isomerase/epimerase